MPTWRDNGKDFIQEIRERTMTEENNPVQFMNTTDGNEFAMNPLINTNSSVFKINHPSCHHTIDGFL